MNAGGLFQYKRVLHRIGRRLLGRRGLETSFAALSFVSGRAPFLDRKRAYHLQREEEESRILNKPQNFRDNRCPACEQRNASAIFKNRVGFQFRICAADGTVYMDPVPIEDALRDLYNGAAETYNYTAQLPESGAQASHAEEFSALMEMLPDSKKGGALLEIGSSVGGFLLTAKSTFDVMGVELNDNTAQVARKCGLDVRTGRVEDLPADHQFDVVVALQVLEHIVAPRDFIRAIKARLKPGGCVYFATPAIDSTSFRWLQSGHIHVASFAHVSLFGQAGLRALANTCDLEVVAHQRYGRDVALHDVVSHALMPSRFRHRMGLYNPRLWYGSYLLEQTPLDYLTHLSGLDKADSYQRVVFQMNS